MADHDVEIRLRGRYAEFLNGKITVEDLDDEELAAGRLKAKDGTFRGRPPMVIPNELVQAMKREWLGRAQEKLQKALLEHGIGTMVELAKDPLVDPAVRLRASQMIVERTMGKVPDKIEVAAEDPVEALFRNILRDPKGLQQPVIAPEDADLLT